jgi:hypothetical protein
MAKQTTNPRAEFYDTHRLIGRLMQFPPFSIDEELRTQIERESIAAIESLDGTEVDAEWNAVHNPLLEKYADDFEEASMWSARTAGKASEAQELALALEGKTPEEIQTYKFLQ